MVTERIYLKDIYPFLGEDNKNPYIDTYLPYNLKEMHRENQKRPCILVCPGGGYGMCSEREAEPIALKFIEDGYNAIVLNYSVVPNRFPTQLCEVAATMELIYKNADNWNCDTEKIGIIGFSAGGHLAAHYSNAYNCEDVRKYFPESKPVNASILSYPVISIAFPECHEGSFINLLGHKPTEKDEIEKFSCEYLVSKDTPPAFIWHTAEDNCVPVKNSLVYAQALSKNGIPFEMHIYPFGCHGLSTCDKLTCDNITNIHNHNAEWITDAKKWLKLTFNI